VVKNNKKDNNNKNFLAETAGKRSVAIKAVKNNLKSVPVVDKDDVFCCWSFNSLAYLSFKERPSCWRRPF
jgi:hypothetical protein